VVTTQKQQAYDHAFKTMLGDRAEMLAYLVPDFVIEQELNPELPRSVLRPDSVLLGHAFGEQYILHMEYQTGEDEEIIARTLEYNALIYRKYHKKYKVPILSLIIYLFEIKNLPETPLHTKIGGEPVLSFYPRVLPLWRLNAQDFVKEHVLAIYPLLPTMQGATPELLQKAIDDMRDAYPDNHKFSQEVLFFMTFLGRTTMVTRADKNKVEEHLGIFDVLVKESSYVRKITAQVTAEAEARGEAKGRAEGEAKAIKGLQQSASSIIEVRFPSLIKEAKPKILSEKDVTALNNLITKLVSAQNEQAARSVLNEK
jgi:predicted transposase YdaD